MAEFKEIEKNIYKLCVPFEDLYTSVFVVISGNDCILIDSASNSDDADNIIIPALNKMGFVPNKFFATHSHGDHFCGFDALKIAYENAPVYMLESKFTSQHNRLTPVKDGDFIAENIKAVAIKGHCDEMAGILDVRTESLISGDGVQLYGVTKYGLGISNLNEYVNSLNKLKTLNIKNLFASHEYIPFGSAARGKENVKNYLNTALYAVYDAENFVAENINGFETFDEIAKYYNEVRKLPAIGSGQAEALYNGYLERKNNV